jgi:ribonuclease P protein component
VVKIRRGITNLTAEPVHFIRVLHKNFFIQHVFTFKPGEKLKSRKLIQQLFKEGKSFSQFPFRIIYVQPGNNRSHLQSAFSVSSKNFRKAVDRNRIKRLMREAYRLQKSSLQDELEKKGKYLAVFMIYTGRELPVYDTIYAKMGSALLRLKEIVQGISAE